MNESESEIVPVDTISPVDTRINLLEKLSDIIERLDHKVHHGRVEVPQNEKIKNEQIRCLISAIRTANDVLDKLELSECLYLLNEIKDTIDNPGTTNVPGIDGTKLDTVESILKMLQED